VCVEVDDNVTRHIDEELERNDWDVMVLHYLGLDHIGHVEGPRSGRVQPKLSEMDGIVQHVVDSLHQQVLVTQLLCADICSPLSTRIAIITCSCPFTAYFISSRRMTVPLREWQNTQISVQFLPILITLLLTFCCLLNNEVF